MRILYYKSDNGWKPDDVPHLPSCLSRILSYINFSSVTVKMLIYPSSVPACNKEPELTELNTSHFKQKCAILF